MTKPHEIPFKRSQDINRDARILLCPQGQNADYECLFLR